VGDFVVAVTVEQRGQTLERDSGGAGAVKRLELTAFEFTPGGCVGFLKKPSNSAHGRSGSKPLQQQRFGPKWSFLYLHLVVKITQNNRLSKKEFVVLSCIQMHSQRKTPVSILRQQLSLSVEAFAKLIGKSIVTVNSLETGRLKLSEETAHTISQETGVAMNWLLAGKTKRDPYFFDPEGHIQPYRKEHFERVQSQKGKAPRFPVDPALNFILSSIIVNDWHSVYNAAVERGDGQLAAYLMRQFLYGLVQRLGKDDEAFLRLNADARVTAANGSVYKWVGEKEGVGGLLLKKVA